MLEALSKARLHLKAEKFVFHKQEVKYLKLIVGKNEVEMHPEKMAAVGDWEPSKCTFDVSSYVDFANFYRRFIKRFSDIVPPLTALTGKGIKFIWSNNCQLSFGKLKKLFTTVLILANFIWDRKILVETGTSDLATAGVLSQYNDDGILRPIAFYLKKHSLRQRQTTKSMTRS